jgi:hypothetical protein
VSGFWRGDGEPRRRVERTGDIAAALETLSANTAKAVLARWVFGASIEAIAEGLGVPPEQARHLVRRGTSILRHPSRSVRLQEYNSVDETVTIDTRLRELIGMWRLEELFAPQCEQCGVRYVPPERGVEREVIDAVGPGRPRRYCSNACRQKAYRQRRR